MCGIAGVWNIGTDAAVERMVGAMHHRGPNDRGLLRDKTAVLGMARLSILDLSHAAHQPMASEDGQIWMVYNGETYNFREERALLVAQGVTFNSQSDTEVVLKLYERYGEDFLLRMRGMFAVAIYDRRRGPGQEKLLLARDHLGIKPLYFARVGNGIVFASELKAILNSGLVPPTVDPESLRQLLQFGSVPQPRTMIRGVDALLPAQKFVISCAGEHTEQYWRLGVNRRGDLASASYDERVEAVAQSLEESVRMQMVSDVPLGAFLSGGIDSSLIVAMMSRLTPQKLRTFSVGYSALGSELDETEDARQIAEFIGTDHTRVEIGPDEVLSRLNHFAWALDQPSVDGANSYFVSMAARRGVTVAISGTGGDELFAGYPWFATMAEYANNASGLRGAVRAGAARLAASRFLDPIALLPAGRRLQTYRDSYGFLGKYSSLHRIFSARSAIEHLDSKLRAHTQRGRAAALDIAHQDELPTSDAVSRVTALCLRGYTSNQLLRDIDSVSMAHSLEARVPFLDPVLADTALSLPQDMKLNQGAWSSGSYAQTGAKKILFDVARHRKLLPKNIAQRQKRGFGMPFDAWLRGPIREALEDALSTATVRDRGFFDAEQVQFTKSEFMNGRTSWPKVWLLMVAELWARNVLKSPSQPPRVPQ